MHLWLDDMREPPEEIYGKPWTWAKTHLEAVECLKTGEVTFASLDHDLADEHYMALESGFGGGWGPATSSKTFREKTGYDTLCYIEENDLWPRDGIRIHTMNTSRKSVMIDVVKQKYGNHFQFQIIGTHKV